MVRRPSSILFVVGGKWAHQGGDLRDLRHRLRGDLDDVRPAGTMTTRACRSSGASPRSPRPQVRLDVLQPARALARAGTFIATDLRSLLEPVVEVARADRRGDLVVDLPGHARGVYAIAWSINVRFATRFAVVRVDTGATFETFLPRGVEDQRRDACLISVFCPVGVRLSSTSG